MKGPASHCGAAVWGGGGAVIRPLATATQRLCRGKYMRMNVFIGNVALWGSDHGSNTQPWGGGGGGVLLYILLLCVACGSVVP